MIAAHFLGCDCLDCLDRRVAEADLRDGDPDLEEPDAEDAEGDHRVEADGRLYRHPWYFRGVDPGFHEDDEVDADPDRYDEESPA